MTTMVAAAARRQHPGLALVVLVALAGLGLAGCSGSLLDTNTAAAPDAAQAQAMPAQPPLAKIAMAPIVGAPDPVAKQIQQEFTAAVEKQRVAVSTAKEDRVDFTLRAYIVAAKDKTATKVSYIWDVTDPTGKRVNRITGEEILAGNASKDPWAAMTPAVAQTIAGKAASSFLAWLPSQAAQGALVSSNVASQPAGVGVQAAAAAPVRQARPAERSEAAKETEQATGSISRPDAVTAIVPAVSGAPGDGNTSLAAAIQRELKSKGVAVSEKPVRAAYRVEGTVTMGQASEGKQPIHIEWLVRDPSGKKLGTVSQKNEIPAGSLDGEWGNTAAQAAGAAAQGIIKLLPVTKAVN